jgi:catechol 2,3-dioxygenase-like lactoylglutathione lyase family enzyme
MAELYQRLSAAGVTFVSPPVHNPDNGRQLCYFRDPDGFTIEALDDRG